MSVQLEILENGIVVELNQSSIDVAIQQQAIDVVFEDGISVEIALGAAVLVPGRGMPSGGTTGQVLAKVSDVPYDTGWTTPAPPEPFMRFQVNPAGAPAVFVADQASTVITATTIGSLNNGTSPQINLGFLANYESATTHPIANGSMGFNIPIDNAFQVAIFHDGAASTFDIIAALVAGTILAGVKATIQIAGFPGLNKVAVFENVGTSTPVQTNLAPVDPTKTSFTILNNVLTVEEHSVALSTATYPYCSILVIQPISGSPTPVNTYTFTNSLTILGSTVIPTEAKDGDLLEIIGSDGVILGSTVKVGDKAFICDDKTALSVIPDVETAADAAQAAAQAYADTKDASTLHAAETYSDLNSARILQAAQDHTNIVVGEAQITDRAYTDNQIYAMQHDGSTFVANVVAGMDIGAGMPVYISRATNKLMLGDSSTYLSSLIVGYTAEPVSNGFAVDVRSGMLTLSDWSAIAGSVSLQLGTLYFLANGGGLTLTPPSLPTDAASVVMGKAVSATKFDFNPALPIQL